MKRSIASSVNAYQDFYENCFFTSTITDWANQTWAIVAPWAFIVKQKLLKFVRPFPNDVFNRHNFIGIKLFLRLQFELSNLCKPNFKQAFKGFYFTVA